MRGRADKDRLALCMGFVDRLDDAFVLLARGAVDLIVLVLPGDGAVGRHLDHAQPVDLHELLGLGRRGAGHARKLFVEAEVVLERHAGQRHVLGLDLDAFLRLDGLMQAVRQAAALHHAAGELVDQHDLAVAHDVLLVLVEQLVRAQRLGDVVNQRRAFRVIKRLRPRRAGSRPRAADPRSPRCPLRCR